MRATQVTKYILRQSGLVLTIALSVSLMAIGFTTMAGELPSGTANNPIPAGAEVCNLDVGFIIDRSNSIRNDSEANPGIITAAVNEVVDDLKGTDTKVAVWSFGTKATGYVGANPLPDSPSIAASDYPGIGFTSVKNNTGAQTVKDTVASIPYESEKSDTTKRRAGWTNWQAALSESIASGDQPEDADIVFMVTDGDPTLPQTNPNGQNPDHSESITAGVVAADGVKANGKTRIVAFAVGQATSDGLYIDNIKRITGGLNDARINSDYFTGNFSQLGSMLRTAIGQACVDLTPDDTPNPGPKDLPNTGIGSSLAIFAGVAVLAAGVYKFRFEHKAKKGKGRTKR